MSSVDSKWIVSTVVALLTGGGWAFIQGIMTLRKKPLYSAKDGARAADQVDASILAIARARDELEEENNRLRNNHRMEREEWAAEKKRLLGEVDRLMTNIQDLMEQLLILREQVREQRKRMDPADD